MRVRVQKRPFVNILAFSRLEYPQKLLNVLLLWTYGDQSKAFRFMVGPEHCTMISKYGPSFTKAVGPVNPSLLVVKKSHFSKKYSSYSESSNSTKQKVHVGSQNSKICLKQPLKKDKRKILIAFDSLMKVERIAECSPWSILQYF